jgi:hypothetical protein
MKISEFLGKWTYQNKFREIKHIKWIDQGLRFDQDLSGYNLGTTATLSTNWVQEAHEI